MQKNDSLFEDLLSKCISGTITEEENIVLLSLVAGSDVYRKKYNETLKLYALLHIPVFEAQKEKQYMNVKKKLHLPTPALPKRNWYLFLRNAAAVFLLMLIVSAASIVMYSHLENREEVLFSETVAPLSSQTKINLPDGTIAVLNSGSTLKYPLTYGKKERNVYLTGEGYFEVAKDEKKVFRVYAGDTKIQVTGTSFNVRSYLEDDFTEISLIEGGVDVFADNKHISLTPDEKAFYNRKTGVLYVEKADTYKAALWTTGRLSFVNTSLVDILKDIERKYNIKIRIESEQVEKEYFSGSINLKMTLQEVFNFIDVDKKFSFEGAGSNLIVLKDK